jgi:hypothetical protein
LKKIRSDQTIYELIDTYPEIKEIMKSLGFDQIARTIMLKMLEKL